MSDEVEKVPGRAGGLARAKKLPPEKRSEIGMKGAAARWGDKPPGVSHVGNFKAEFGVDVECFVLNNPQKTAVISQTGMARVFGMSPSGSTIPRFITTKGMVSHVGVELREKLENPLRFQWGFDRVGVPPSSINGFEAELLIDLCQAILAANAKGDLSDRRHAGIVRQAQIILSATAKSGIRNVVYALAGYNPTAEEVIAAFKLYIQEEARKYESEFPPELYVQWHRLYELPVPVRGKPWHFAHLTVRHIYFPLAKSSGKILTLLRALKAKDGDRHKKLFQFLNDIGARALRIHLGRVLEMAEDSKARVEYENKIAQRFGGQPELDLVLPNPPTASPRPS